MAFDAGKVFEDMIGAASSVLSEEWPKVQSCVLTAFDAERAALEAIATARITGAIDDDDMRSQLEDEQVALKVALLACKVKGKTAAQRAANAAIDVLNDAIKLALLPL